VIVGGIDSEQRRLAERLVIGALRRFHREQPLSVDLRTDALVQRVRVGGQRPLLVGAVGRHGGGRVAAHPGGDRPVAGLGERGQLVAPAVRAVGEAVEAERQRAGPELEVREVDVVGADRALRRFHGSSWEGM